MATKPHLSLDSAVKFLISTMRDPMKANGCAWRMGLAADRIEQALEACTSIAEKTKIAKSFPEFLRVGIRFLTRNHSPQDHVTMVNHLIRCRCDFTQHGMKRLHKPNRYRVDGRIKIEHITLIFDVVTTVGNCLMLALNDLTQHKFRTGNANNGEPRWPQGPEDLLPNGCKDSLVGLEHWVASAPDGYIIFKLAGCLALFHAPFSKEVFQYPHFIFALARPVEHLAKAIAFYDEGDSSPLARTHFFTNPVKTIFDFFDNISLCDRPVFNIMISARGRWISPVLPRLTTIMSTAPSDWGNTLMTVQFISAYANAEVDPQTGVVLVKFERKLLTGIPYYDMLEEAFKSIVDARRSGCWNVTCSSASEVVYSRLCSKCNLIRFCGEKCQKEAWKCAQLPHKAVCAKAYSLKESLGSDNWSLLGTPDFTYAQFQALCEAKKVDAETVKAIGRTIGALRVRRAMLQEESDDAKASQVERLAKANRKKLARQRLEDIRDQLHPSPPIVGREEWFSTTFRDACQ